jgi:hypothetical protein
MIRTLARHPVVTLGAGVIIGYVFAKQIGSAPVVGKIPQKA